jgi:uncharacterized protein (TIGR03083 family)
MGDAAAALMDAWDRVLLNAHQIEAADWSRPTPCPAFDVRGLVTHVATPMRVGPRLATPAGLLEQLRAARQREAGRTTASPGQDRLLGAGCLDLWVHNYDLARALDAPLDLTEDVPAAREGCRYLLRLAPHLFATRGGAPEDSRLRVAVQGAHESVLAVHAGRGQWRADAGGASDSVTGTPTAFILLLSGRGRPEFLRDVGQLQWSGAAGEAFVRHARLPG